MAEQLITIKEVADKDGKKGPYKIVTSDNGAKFYAFDPETFQCLKAGANVRLEVERQGDYHHIKGVAIAPSPSTALIQPPQVKPVPAQQPAPVTNRDSSIEAQVAFKGLVELDVAGRLDLVTHVAIVQWAVIKMGLDIHPETANKPIFQTGRVNK